MGPCLLESQPTRNPTAAAHGGGPLVLTCDLCVYLASMQCGGRIWICQPFIALSLSLARGLLILARTTFTSVYDLALVGCRSGISPNLSSTPVDPPFALPVSAQFLVFDLLSPQIQQVEIAIALLYSAPSSALTPSWLRIRCRLFSGRNPSNKYWRWGKPRLFSKLLAYRHRPTADLASTSRRLQRLLGLNTPSYLCHCVHLLLVVQSGAGGDS